MPTTKIKEIKQDTPVILANPELLQKDYSEKTKYVQIIRSKAKTADGKPFVAYSAFLLDRNPDDTFKLRIRKGATEGEKNAHVIFNVHVANSYVEEFKTLKLPAVFVLDPVDSEGSYFFTEDTRADGTLRTLKDGSKMYALVLKEACPNFKVFLPTIDVDQF